MSALGRPVEPRSPSWALTWLILLSAPPALHGVQCPHIHLRSWHHVHPLPTASLPRDARYGCSALHWGRRNSLITCSS